MALHTTYSSGRVNIFSEKTETVTFGKQTEKFKTIQDWHKVMAVLQRLIFLILSFHNSRIMWVIFGMFSSHGRTREGKLVQIRTQIPLINLVCVNETFFKPNSKICITFHIVGKTKRMPEFESTWNKSWGLPSEKTNLFCNWQNLFSHLE